MKRFIMLWLCLLVVECAVMMRPTSAVALDQQPGIVQLAPNITPLDAGDTWLVQNTQPPVASTPSLAAPRAPFGRNRRAPTITGLTGLVGAYSTSVTRTRLASVPDMFGDFLWRGTSLTATDPLSMNNVSTGALDLPAAGGGRGTLVGELNKPLPVDRVYFSYHHFHNALENSATSSVGATVARDVSLDRFIVGWEQTFADGLWSVDVRMPMMVEAGFDATVSGSVNGRVTAEGGVFGNLAIVLKRLVYESDSSAFAVGLGIETPTGSDAEALVGRLRYLEFNDAVYLLPYVAWMQTPTDDCFYQAFVQLDIPTNGNRIQLTNLTKSTSRVVGIYNEQALLHVNLSAGHWLYRDSAASPLTGIASLVELHYTTALQDSDILAGTESIGGETARFMLQNRAGRNHMLNLTVGLHTELSRDATLRVAGVLPLLDGDDRAFDAELTVQAMQRY